MAKKRKKKKRGRALLTIILDGRQKVGVNLILEVLILKEKGGGREVRRWRRREREIGVTGDTTEKWGEKVKKEM